jgi:hypothetical protein
MKLNCAYKVEKAPNNQLLHVFKKRYQKTLPTQTKEESRLILE